MGLHEELSCHQEGDTGCRGRGQIKGMGDRLVPLGTAGSAHLSPLAKGLEPSKLMAQTGRAGGDRSGVEQVLPLVSLGMSWGWVMSP